MKITIIGAGIGGLTTAIALKQKGFDVELFEASHAFKKAGSGINLAINAMQVYKKLGLYETLLKAGSYNQTMNISDENLTPISVIDMCGFEETFNVKSVAIHRAVLHEILLNELSDVPIYMGKKLKTLTSAKNETSLTFEDGTSHKATVLIGADGIHSVVRKALFNATQIRDAKQICWRGITKIELPSTYQTQLVEQWGKGKRFGFVSISETEYYWYALANYKTDARAEFKDLNLVDFYADFHPIVGDLLKSTPKKDRLTHTMMDLKPLTTWHKNKVCLLGDSAHATTPNFGQGACQAIESAYALANCLASNALPEKAFEAFQKIRIEKATDIVNTSWRIGKLAHLENRFLIKLRNLVLRNTPSSITQKQSQRMFDVNG